MTRPERASAIGQDIWSDERIRNGAFYTLPMTLITAIETLPLIDRLDRTAWDFERRVAMAFEDRPGVVGTRFGRPIQDPHLRPIPELQLTDSGVQAMKRGWVEQGHQCKGLDDLISGDASVELGRIRQAQRAYLGWLFSNRTFLGEFQILQREQHLFQTPELLPQPIDLGQARPGSIGLREVDDPAARAVGAFTSRWRLLNVSGPRTVAIPGPQTPHVFPLSAAAVASQSRATASHPDILPLPGRDELRRQFDAQRRSGTRDNEHLREWTELVESDTQGRRRMESYHLWYELQHYLKVFYERHGDRLRRAKGAVQEAFAIHLERSEDTVRRAMDQISDRLGRDWWWLGPRA